MLIHSWVGKVHSCTQLSALPQGGHCGATNIKGRRLAVTRPQTGPGQHQLGGEKHTHHCSHCHHRRVWVQDNHNH